MNRYNAVDGYECDECYEDSVPLVEMRSEQDDNGPWFCADCLRAALALLEPPQPLDRVQEPASHADSQQHGDDGEDV